MNDMWLLDSGTLFVKEWQPLAKVNPYRFSGWGYELGDWCGFSAPERNGGLAVKYHSIQTHEEASMVSTAWDFSLPHGRWSVTTEDKIIEPGLQIIRRLDVRNTLGSTGWIGDLVIRTVLPLDENITASFDGVGEIYHRNSNHYLETEEESVYLKWPDGRILKFSWLSNSNPLSMTRYWYVRDQPANIASRNEHCLQRAWVVHGRILVDYPAAYVFRLWRNPFVVWSRLLPRFFHRFEKRFGDRWRAAEYRTYRRGSLYGLWPILPGEALSLAVSVSVAC